MSKSTDVLVFERELFKALANETRLEILRMLREQERCVSELVSDLEEDQTNISHNLRFLLRCGFVDSRRDGKRIIYKIHSREVAEIFDLMERHMERNRDRLMRLMKE